MLQIRDILERIRIRKSVPLSNDPDPALAIFATDLQDTNEKLFFVLSFSA
jgi:hypothetical protein